MLVVDGGNDRLGIGIAAPDTLLHARLPSTSTASLFTFDRSDGAVSGEIKYDDTAAVRGFEIGTTTQHDIALKTNDTTRVQVSQGGWVTMPTQPAFLAVAATQNNVTGDSTDYTVLFAGSEAFDQNADFNGSNTFTAPVTGRYLLSTHIFCTGAADNHVLGYFAIVASNRTVYNNLLVYNSQSGEELRDNITTFLDMDANDTATVFLDIRGGSKTVDVEATSTFSGVLVC
jgi:hypothetical protein